MRVIAIIFVLFFIFECAKRPEQRQEIRDHYYDDPWYFPNEYDMIPEQMICFHTSMKG